MTGTTVHEKTGTSCVAEITVVAVTGIGWTASLINAPGMKTQNSLIAHSNLTECPSLMRGVHSMICIAKIAVIGAWLQETRRRSYSG